jgi:hypothetical protein
MFWFVGVILLCYLIYPLMMRYGSNNKVRLLLISAAIFALFLAIRLSFGIVDTRFFLYYFVFVSGIAASIFHAKLLLDKRRTFVGAALLLTALVTVHVAIYKSSTSQWSELCIQRRAVWPLRWHQLVSGIERNGVVVRAVALLFRQLPDFFDQACPNAFVHFVCFICYLSIQPSDLGGLEHHLHRYTLACGVSAGYAAYDHRRISVVFDRVRFPTSGR